MNIHYDHRYINEFNIQKVLNSLNELCNQSEKIDSFFNVLKCYGNLILIGGAIRDIAINNQRPRDFDIIIDTDAMDIDQAFKNFNYIKNRFGGYKTRIDGYEFDVWTIQNNWAFKENVIEEGAKNISKGTFYNFDSIILNLNNNEWDAENFNEAIRYNKLDIIIEDEYIDINPTPDINVLRALVIRKMWGVEFSNKLEKYINRWVAKSVNPIDDLYKAQIKHYKKNNLLNQNDFKQVLFYKKS